MTSSKPSREEIEAQLRLAQDRSRAGQSCYPDLTYEDGVALTLEWICDGASPPIDEDDTSLPAIAQTPIESERIAVLRLTARVTNETLAACMRRIAMEWSIDDVRHFLEIYSEQRVARAALVAIAADVRSGASRQALLRTAVEAPLGRVSDALGGQPRRQSKPMPTGAVC
jgi:hypothetical protein